MLLEHALLLAFLGGVVDRVRGSGVVHIMEGKASAQVVYGWLYATLLSFTFVADPIFTPLLIAAFTLGVSIGWANPTGGALRKDWDSMDPDNFYGARGNEYEWWQLGYMRINPYFALFCRGLLWGAPISAVLYFASTQLLWLIPLVVFPLCVPLAILLAAYTPHWYGENTWEAQEKYRGWLVCFSTVGLVFTEPYWNVFINNLVS